MMLGDWAQPGAAEPAQESVARGWRLKGVAALALLLVVLSALSLLCGSVWLAPDAFVGDDPLARMARLILVELRLPRLVMAWLVGGTLGLSGAVLQGMTRNPLAEPGLLGVSSGAAFGAVVAIYFDLAVRFPAAVPLLGLCGAAAAMALTFALARGGGTLALILAGSAVTALMVALTDLALNLAANPYAAYEISTWLMGSLADKSWSQVLLALPFVATGIGMLALTGRALDALSLGEAQAESLGINLGRLRLLTLAGTALAVGAATAFTGAVGFVGLVAPHVVRPLLGYQPARLLWPSALAGATLLLAADMATRLIHVGPELKLGVLTALVGTPFFFALVVHLRKTSP